MGRAGSRSAVAARWDHVGPPLRPASAHASSSTRSSLNRLHCRWLGCLEKAQQSSPTQAPFQHSALGHSTRVQVASVPLSSALQSPYSPCSFQWRKNPSHI